MPIDPKPVQLETLKQLIELADKDLTRIHGIRFADIRSRTIFYQSFAIAMLAAHVAAWKLLGVETGIEILTSSLSAAAFCVVLFLSVFSMSGANYRMGAIQGYSNWFLSIKGTPEEQIDLYQDILKKYDIAILDAQNVAKVRGKYLRALNLITMVGLVLSAISLVALIS